VFASGSFPDTHFFNPATSQWTNGPRTIYGNTRTYGSSVLLGLTPPSYTPRVLIVGGNDPATPTAEIIDLSVPSPAWQSVQSMTKARIEMNATLLPNGKVLASGGSTRDEDATTASKQAELFDPATGTWSSAGTASRARLYHSVALLLPDATVVTAGSNPQRGTYDQFIEIWKPPYLFDASGNLAARPGIASAPSSIGYGSSFQVQMPGATGISSVVLMRPGSSTHAFDMEQRLVGLSFTRTGATLNVTAPPNANVAPPGYYMLFILNNAGVPSIARFIQVSSTPNQAPQGTITQPATDVTVQIGQPVTFAATASDPDGTVATFSWVFPGGTPDGASATSGAPLTVTFATAGTYIASLTVVDNQGASDPSPDTRVITITPSLSVSGTSGATPGGAVTVAWSGIASPTPTDWVGLYTPGAADTAIRKWVYVSCSVAPGAPKAAGSCSFGLPAALPSGSYEMRLFSNDGFTRLATSAPFTVATGAVAVSEDPSPVAAGGIVAAAWNSIASPTPTDWIGLYVPGSPNTAILDWVYVSCSKAAGPARPIGVCPFSIPGTLSPGNYELRLFANDGFTRLAVSRSFVVTASSVTVSEAPSTVARGGTVTATWNAIVSPMPMDWIGLYTPGAPDSALLAWVYISCSLTPGAPRAAGSCPFAVPAGVSPGTYELRLYSNDLFNWLATSNAFTVTP
jgi:Galactose oxidase-like, Early set domain/PKD domain